MNNGKPKTFRELRTHAESLLVDTIYRIIIIVRIPFLYGVALFSEDLLMSYVSYQMQAYTEQYPFLGTAVDYFRIGLFMMLIFGATVHSCFSALSLLEMDWDLLGENIQRVFIRSSDYLLLFLKKIVTSPLKLWNLLSSLRPIPPNPQDTNDEQE